MVYAVSVVRHRIQWMAIPVVDVDRGGSRIEKGREPMGSAKMSNGAKGKGGFQR